MIIRDMCWCILGMGTILGEEDRYPPSSMLVSICSPISIGIASMSAAEEVQEDSNAHKSAIPTFLLLPGGGENCCVSKQVFIDSRNEKKILFLLCIGLKNQDNKQPLFLLESKP